MTSTRPDPSILSGLTQPQREAAQHTGGPLLIVAGPGSGKTRVMAHRVAYLVAEVGVPPFRILAVTFTNKAARELRERCESLLGGEVPGLQVRTFHAFCSQFLRVEGGLAGFEQGFSIYDDDDQQRLMKQILADLEVDTKRYSARAVLGAISDAKNRMLDARHYEPSVGSYFEEIVARAYGLYEQRLQEANALDFDDLLLVTNRILANNPEVLQRYQNRFEYLLVDEFQDTNPIQFSLAKLLAGGHRNICVVGDPNQSIYSWRHADPRNMLEFQKVYPDAKIVRLDQNYRSTQTIIEAASAVIANNQGRLRNSLWTENEAGAPIAVAEAYSEEDEAELVMGEVTRLVEEEGMELGRIAVMYRVNAQSRAIEVACNRHAIPYQLVGGLKFYERREIRDLVAYLRVIVNPADDIALERIINTPARGISQKTIDTIRAAARLKERSMWEAIASIGLEDDAISDTLNSRALKSVQGFADLIRYLADRSHLVGPVELIDEVLDKSGYRAFIEEDRERGEERLENLMELRGAAEEYEGPEPRARIIEFLENTALVSDLDQMPEEETRQKLTLITLHQAKGLEFDAVFMVGMEEGLLPHIRSLESEADLEEERRLCYVGMTRARRRLYMVRAFRRAFRGGRSVSMPSRFLTELPPSHTIRKSAFSSLMTQSRRENIPTPAQIRRAASAATPKSATHTEEFSAGDRVHHQKFGDGVVVSVKGNGTDAELTVAFDGQGIKRLLAGFAPIQRLSGEAKIAPAETPEG